MSRSLSSQHKGNIRGMFSRIARRYDLLNSLMTFGQDARWRRQAVKRLAPSDSGKLLDVGAGTGALSLEILHRAPHAFVVALDFTPEMIARGRTRRGAERIQWVIGDAMNLPFARGSFDGVISGFLLRNLDDLDRALEQQRRVLRPKGKVVALETSANERNLFVRMHFDNIIPLLGRLVAGDAEAYNYLPASMDAFLRAPELCERLRLAGLEGVAAERRMFGTIGIHWGCKADD